MSKLNPLDPNFIKKMYQYNRKFRSYVDNYIRSGRYSKEQILELHIAREVAMYYFYGDQTEEPDVVQTVVVPSC